MSEKQKSKSMISTLTVENPVLEGFDVNTLKLLNYNYRKRYCYFVWDSSENFSAKMNLNCKEADEIQVVGLCEKLPATNYQIFSFEIPADITPKDKYYVNFTLIHEKSGIGGMFGLISTEYHSTKYSFTKSDGFCYYFILGLRFTRDGRETSYSLSNMEPPGRHVYEELQEVMIFMNMIENDYIESMKLIKDKKSKDISDENEFGITLGKSYVFTEEQEALIEMLMKINDILLVINEKDYGYYFTRLDKLVSHISLGANNTHPLISMTQLGLINSDAFSMHKEIRPGKRKEKRKKNEKLESKYEDYHLDILSQLNNLNKADLELINAFFKFNEAYELLSSLKNESISFEITNFNQARLCKLHHKFIDGYLHLIHFSFKEGDGEWIDVLTKKFNQPCNSNLVNDSSNTSKFMQDLFAANYLNNNYLPIFSERSFFIKLHDLIIKHGKHLTHNDHFYKYEEYALSYYFKNEKNMKNRNQSYNSLLKNILTLSCDKETFIEFISKIILEDKLTPANFRWVKDECRKKPWDEANPENYSKIISKVRNIRKRMLELAEREKLVTEINKEAYVDSLQSNLNNSNTNCNNTGMVSLNESDNNIYNNDTGHKNNDVDNVNQTQKQMITNKELNKQAINYDISESSSSGFIIHNQDLYMKHFGGVGTNNNNYNNYNNNNKSKDQAFFFEENKYQSLAEELEIFLYEISKRVDYLFTLLKQDDYKSVDVKLFKQFFNTIYEFDLDDYAFIIKDLNVIPISIKSEILDQGFFEGIKYCLKKLELPFDDDEKENVKLLLLNKELFPMGSLPYIKEFLKAKPDIKDLILIMEDLLMPQKNLDSNIYWENLVFIKNYLVNSIKDIHELVNVFSTVVDHILIYDDSKTSKINIKENANSNISTPINCEDDNRKYCVEFWNSLYHRYSPEDFLNLIYFIEKGREQYLKSLKDQKLEDEFNNSSVSSALAMNNKQRIKKANEMSVRKTQNTGNQDNNDADNNNEDIKNNTSNEFNQLLVDCYVEFVEETFNSVIGLNKINFDNKNLINSVDNDRTNDRNNDKVDENTDERNNDDSAIKINSPIFIKSINTVYNPNINTIAPTTNTMVIEEEDKPIATDDVLKTESTNKNINFFGETGKELQSKINNANNANIKSFLIEDVKEAFNKNLSKVNQFFNNTIFNKVEYVKILSEVNAENNNSYNKTSNKNNYNNFISPASRFDNDWNFDFHSPNEYTFNNSSNSYNKNIPQYTVTKTVKKTSIVCDDSFSERCFNTVLDILYRLHDPELSVKEYIIENVAENHFWSLLLNISGKKAESILNHKYIKAVKSSIHGLFCRILDQDLLVEDFLNIQKQTKSAREAMLKYYTYLNTNTTSIDNQNNNTSISNSGANSNESNKNSKSNLKSMSLTEYTQQLSSILSSIETKLHIFSQYEIFFASYGNKILSSKENKFIRETKQSFSKILYKDFIIPENISSNLSSVININTWGRSTAFKNTFNECLRRYIEENNLRDETKVVSNKEKEDDDVVSLTALFETERDKTEKQMLELKNIVVVFKKTCDEVTTSLNNILNPLNDSMVDITLIIKIFTGLDSSENEVNELKNLIKLRIDEVERLRKFLTVFEKMASLVKFSEIMIKVNIFLGLNKADIDSNNSHFSLYQQFLKLVNKPNQLFNDIVFLAEEINNIRTKYLSSSENNTTTNNNISSSNFKDNLYIESIDESSISNINNIKKEKRNAINENLESILTELIDSTELLNFVLATPEEDIKNMVDAVDEHGDSFIRVQTIRDLLIVGSFSKYMKLDKMEEVKEIIIESNNTNNNNISNTSNNNNIESGNDENKTQVHKVVLVKYGNYSSEKEFIETLKQVMLDNQSFSSIDAVLKTCSKQFMGIKHLHKELSNREEASKTKAKEITIKSFISFIYSNKSDENSNTNNNNSNDSVYDVHVKYFSSNSSSYKSLYLKDILELRDRVLLLIYNEKERFLQENTINKNNNSNTEEIINNTKEKDDSSDFRNCLQKFISIVDTTELVLNTLNEIVNSGYPNIITKEVAIEKADTNSIELFLNQIISINNNWKEDLKAAYFNYYPLTFYQGKEFWILERCLSSASKLDNKACLPLLRYINPDISYESYQDKIADYNFSGNNNRSGVSRSAKERIFKLGEVLMKIFESIFSYNIITDTNNSNSTSISMINTNTNVNMINTSTTTNTNNNVNNPFKSNPFSKKKLSSNNNFKLPNISYRKAKILVTFTGNLRIYHNLISLNFSIESCLPHSHQIFYCNKNTSFHELASFLYRYVYSPQYKLFHIIKVENLTFDLQSYLINEIHKLTSKSFPLNKIKSMLSILCTEPNSYIHEQFTENHSEYIYKTRPLDFMTDDELTAALSLLLKNSTVIRSDLTGVGKTTYIKKQIKEEHKYVNIPIHDSIDLNRIANRLANINYQTQKFGLKNSIFSPDENDTESNINNNLELNINNNNNNNNIIGNNNQIFEKDSNPVLSFVDANINYNTLLENKFIHINISGIIDDYEALDYLLFQYLILSLLKIQENVAIILSSDTAFIEVANTFNDQIFTSLSVLSLLKEKTLINKNHILDLDLNCIFTKKDLLLVCNYLAAYTQGLINDQEINPLFSPLTEFSAMEALNYLMINFIKEDDNITFRQVQTFVSIIADQIKKFSMNVFFNIDNIRFINDNRLSKLREMVISVLLKMTEEFTNRNVNKSREEQNLVKLSLKKAKSSQNRDEVLNDAMKEKQFAELTQVISWQNSNHLILVFHEDGMCFTPVYRTTTNIPSEVRDLMISQHSKLEDYQALTHKELLKKLFSVVGRSLEYIPELFETNTNINTTSSSNTINNMNTEYVLTADNFLKMLLIVLRSRSKVPIVIMGETGCGKTSLVKFLSTMVLGEEFEVINFHAGIKESYILQRMKSIFSKAKRLKDSYLKFSTNNNSVYNNELSNQLTSLGYSNSNATAGYNIWVFFDEINTCDSLGLLNEIICERSVHGVALPDNVICIAACNPYKLRKDEEEVGLIKDRVASRLVYTVHPLPDAMIDYVWDYGHLSDKEEFLYISKMLSGISGQLGKLAVEIVCQSQKFIRNCESNYSVSLRDVARFKTLHEWFYTNIEEKNMSEEEKMIRRVEAEKERMKKEKEKNNEKEKDEDKEGLVDRSLLYNNNKNFSSSIYESALPFGMIGYSNSNNNYNNYSNSYYDSSISNYTPGGFRNNNSNNNFNRYSNNNNYNNYSAYNNNPGYSNFSNIKYTGKLAIARKALIFSLMMCYYNRISKNTDRNNYKKVMTSYLQISETQLDEMILEEQTDILKRMELPPAIAINQALLENAFTLLVCIINKIPLFICGKPGCSKSLAVQLIVSNLRGNDSNDSFFKTLPKILPIPYQGSESSTSEGIERIFSKANNVVKSNTSSNNTNSNILPLIVFDEIGLAEISKNNPLKILHSLLEPDSPTVAFVGISNWRLDASKMNRAIYLARPDPDLEDLIKTAMSIFNYYIKQQMFDEDLVMKALARTYFEFKKEGGDFHGTRDFYSLIKQVTKGFSDNYSNYNDMKLLIIREALLRNFGGLNSNTSSNSNSNKKDILTIFSNIFANINDYNTYNNSYSYTYNNTSSTNNSSIIKYNPNFSLFKKLNETNEISPLDLVRLNLEDTSNARYLLLFTNGESASYIIDNYLCQSLSDKVFLIGSEFEEDKGREDYSFRLLSDIILYMETGSSVVMKNLDQVYGALYDLFNQNFMIVGQKKNCRIALGSTNNPMCYVNNNFHCVVLVDIKDSGKMDPPFLNRFEKQIVTFDSVLNSRQRKVVAELEEFVALLTSLKESKDNDYSDYDNKSNDGKFKDMIITYNSEFIQSVVLSKDVKSKKTNNNANNTSNNEDIYSDYLDDENVYVTKLVKECKKEILNVCSISMITYSVLSQLYHLSMNEVETIHKIYFNEQFHDSIDSYLVNQSNTNSGNFKSIVYTFSNILEYISLKKYCDSIEEKLKKNGIKDNSITNSTNNNSISANDNERENVDLIVYYLNVAEIKSEKDLENRLKQFYSSKTHYLLLIRVDHPKEIKHMALIKFKVDKMHSEYIKQVTISINNTSNNSSNTDAYNKAVCMIVYLSKSKLSNYNSNEDSLSSQFLSNWSQMTIDCLNGGQIHLLKDLINYSTMDLIKKNLTSMTVSQSIFTLFLKFNFIPHYRGDQKLIKAYMNETLTKIESNEALVKLIGSKIISNTESKTLPDWKMKIFSDPKIISKSLNPINSINEALNEITEEPLLKVIHSLEYQSALFSYFYQTDNIERIRREKEIIDDMKMREVNNTNFAKEKTMNSIEESSDMIKEPITVTNTSTITVNNNNINVENLNFNSNNNCSEETSIKIQKIWVDIFMKVNLKEKYQYNVTQSLIINPVFGLKFPFSKCHIYEIFIFIKDNLELLLVLDSEFFNIMQSIKSQLNSKKIGTSDSDNNNINSTNTNSTGNITNNNNNSHLNLKHEFDLEHISQYKDIQDKIKKQVDSSAVIKLLEARSEDFEVHSTLTSYLFQDICCFFTLEILKLPYLMTSMIQVFVTNVINDTSKISNTMVFLIKNQRIIYSLFNILKGIIKENFYSEEELLLLIEVFCNSKVSKNKNYSTLAVQEIKQFEVTLFIDFSEFITKLVLNKLFLNSKNADAVSKLLNKLIICWQTTALDLNERPNALSYLIVINEYLKICNIILESLSDAFVVFSHLESIVSEAEVDNIYIEKNENQINNNTTSIKDNKNENNINETTNNIINNTNYDCKEDFKLKFSIKMSVLYSKIQNKINLNDFSIIPKLLNFIDKKKKDADEMIKMSFLSSVLTIGNIMDDHDNFDNPEHAFLDIEKPINFLDLTVINSKLIIFENALNHSLQEDFFLNSLILNHIVVDPQLLRRSGMIMFRLFSTKDFSRDFTCLKEDDTRLILERILGMKGANSYEFVFFVDFFKKMLDQPNACTSYSNTNNDSSDNKVSNSSNSVNILLDYLLSRLNLFSENFSDLTAESYFIKMLACAFCKNYLTIFGEMIATVYSHITETNNNSTNNNNSKYSLINTPYYKSYTEVTTRVYSTINSTKQFEGIERVKEFILKPLAKKLGNAQKLLFFEFNNYNIPYYNNNLFDKTDNKLGILLNLNSFNSSGKVPTEFNKDLHSLITINLTDGVAKLKEILKKTSSSPMLKVLFFQFLINKVFINFSNAKYAGSTVHEHLLHLFLNKEIKDEYDLCFKSSSHPGIYCSSHTNNHNLDWDFTVALLTNFGSEEVSKSCNNINTINNNGTIDISSFISNKNNSIKYYFQMCNSDNTSLIGYKALFVINYSLFLSYNYNPYYLSLNVFIDSFDSKVKDTHTSKTHINANPSSLDSTSLIGGYIDYENENLYLIMKDVTDNFKNYTSVAGLYECQCGYIYTIGDCTRPYYIGKCPKCGEKIGGESHNLVVTSKCLINADKCSEKNKQEALDNLRSKITLKPGYIVKTPDEFPPNYGIRHMSPLAFRFFSLVNHSTLLMHSTLVSLSCDLNNDEKKRFKENLLSSININCNNKSTSTTSNSNNSDDQVKDLEGYLIKHLDADITKINQFVKINDDYIIMLSLLNVFAEKYIKITNLEYKNVDKNNNFSKYISTSIDKNNKKITLIDYNKIKHDIDTFIDGNKDKRILTTKSRDDVEKLLTNEVAKILKNEKTLIQEYKNLNSVDSKKSYTDVIDENFTTKDLINFNLTMTPDYLRVFRLTEVGNLSILRNAYNRVSSDSYRLLKLILDRHDDIMLLAYLNPIITFSNYMLNMFNLKLTRNEAKEVKLRDYLNSNSTLKRLYDKFRTAWKNIYFKCTQYNCKLLPSLKDMDPDLPISFFLIDDRELGYGMYLASAMQVLGQIQNDLVESIVYLFTEGSANFEIWSKFDTRKQPIQKISYHEIITCDPEYFEMLISVYSKFYEVYSWEFGDGTRFSYNFEKIESELSFKLLTNKKLLNFEELSKIEYKFELLSVQNKNSNLLNDINSKVTQLVMSVDEKNYIKKILERFRDQNVAYIHQIFSSTEIILCTLKYTAASQVNGNMELHRFVTNILLQDSPNANNLSNINNKLFEGKDRDNNNIDNNKLQLHKVESVIKDNKSSVVQGISDRISPFIKETVGLKSIKLSNIVEFYELLEEILYDNVLSFISPEFKVKLDESQRDEVRAYLEQSTVSLDLIIRVMKRFIMRCLVATIEPSFPLVEYLTRIDFWDVGTKEDLIDSFYNSFGYSVLIKNTVDCLNFVIEYQIIKKEEKASGEKFDLFQKDLEMIENLKKKQSKKNKYI